MLTADVELIEQWDEDPVVRAAIDGRGADWYDWPIELARDVAWRELLIAEEAGRAVGFVQLTDANDEETGYWNDPPAGSWAIDIWLGDAADRGRGLGTEVMDAAIRRVFEQHHATSIVIDPLASNSRAIEFYRRLGFAEIDDQLLDDEKCIVMQLHRP